MKQLSLLRFIKEEQEKIDYQSEIRNLVNELKLIYFKLIETYKNHQVEELLILIKELEDIIESYSYL